MSPLSPGSGRIRRGACKPGSVMRAVCVSTPAPQGQPFISALRCRRAPATNPGDHGAKHPCPDLAAGRAAPIRSCSGWGLPCGPRCRVPGALLPHPFTLACAGYGHRRIALCGTFPRLRTFRPEPSYPRRAGVTRHPCFVEPGLSSTKRTSTRLPGPPTRWLDSAKHMADK
jgi:hypothetical protein